MVTFGVVLMELKGTFWNVGNILYFDLNDDFLVDTYIKIHQPTYSKLV